MSNVRWLDEENGIILLKFPAGGTMDAFMADYATFAEMVGSAGRKTYTIVDFLDLDAIPAHAMSHFPQMAKLTPRGERRSEVIALVSQKTLITTVADIYGKVYPDFKNRFAYFASVEQALTHIYDFIRQSPA